MRSSELPSLDELSQMREKLNRIEQQIRKSQREFSNNILISNTNKSRFRLTINIEDSPGKETKIIPNSIHIPNSSATSQKLTPEKRFLKVQEQHQKEEAGQIRRDEEEQILEGSRFRSEKRFSSPNNNPISFEYGSRRIAGLKQKEKEQAKHQEIFIKDDESEIQLQSLSIPLSHLKDKGIKTFRESEDLAQEESIIKQKYDQQKSKSLQDTPETVQSIEGKQEYDSPLVYSYIHQQPQKQHPEVNTPNEERPFQIRDFLMIDPNNPKPKDVLFTKKLRIEEIEDTINLSTGLNPKTKEEGLVSKINNFTNRITAPLKDTFFNQKKTFEKSISTDRSQQKKHQRYSSSEDRKSNIPQKKYFNAEKLVKERKQLIMTPANVNPKTDRQKSKQQRNRNNRFLGSRRQKGNSKSSQKYALSPKLQEITDRLHNSKQKQSPCSYYSKYNESSQRERFNLMVNQNPFVARYVCSSEREELFQKLRSSSDSISLWPMKIVSYTYSKLQRSLSAVQSLIQ